MRDLREQLHDAAEAHRPDRARILARVRRGTAATRRPAPGRRRSTAGLWPRALAAAAATCALLVGGYTLADRLLPEDSGTAAPASPAPSPAESALPTVESPLPSVEDGPLWSDGSLDPGSSTYWSQGNVTLDTREPLAELTVELWIVPSDGVSSTGSWRTLPPEDFHFSVREEGNALVYRWTLREGRTVPAGRHVFAGQYDHDAGRRDAGRDLYTARALTPDGRALAVRGDFAPTP